MNISWVIPLVAGWAGGWLVNYLADVLPLTRRFSRPACLHCAAPYPWEKYLAFQACPACGKNRAMRAWLVQLFLMAASVYTWFSPPLKIGYALGMLLLLYLSMDFVIDLEHRLILHPTSIFGALFGLGIGLLRQGLVPTLVGGLAGFGIMFLFYLFGLLFARIRARRMRAAGEAADDEEALGAGDVILCTILGLILGWPLIWFGLLFGILLGGAVSLLLVIGLFASRQYKQKAWMIFLPYGPYFLFSTFLLIYLPNWIQVIVPK